MFLDSEILFVLKHFVRLFFEIEGFRSSPLALLVSLHVFIPGTYVTFGCVGFIQSTHQGIETTLNYHGLRPGPIRTNFDNTYPVKFPFSEIRPLLLLSGI